MMKTEKKKSGGFYLKWPWNALVYIILAGTLGLLAVPVILLIMAWNKKQQPDGPEEGYCLQRTRRRLARLGWAVLFLFIGVAMSASFIFEVQADKSAWETMDYVYLVIAAVGGLGGIIAGLYEGYTDIRDALFPDKSRIAKSIRSQLPDPDAIPDVRELFAMVDRDIQENGQWFDRVAVGKEWIFGDDVTAISRMRVVFGRDEIVRHYLDGRTQRARVVELYILDDRKQLQMTGLRDPNELKPLLACLKLREPDALFLPYSQYMDYISKSKEEWENLNREFRKRKGQREMETFQNGSSLLQQAQNMVLTRGDGSVTSRLSPELLKQTLRDCLRAGGVQNFFLTPNQPVEVDGHALYELQCVTTLKNKIKNPLEEDLAAFGSVELVLKAVPEQPGGRPEYGFMLATGLKQGEDILCSWLRGDKPKLRDWTRTRLWTTQTAQPQQAQDQMSLTNRAGITRNYTTFTRRDVELAGEGLASGKYSMITLKTKAGYIYIQSGTKEDGRAIVQASRFDSDKFRLYEIKCRDRQAQEWLLQLADGHFSPDFSQWKEVTKKMQREMERLAKAKK